MLNGAKMKSPGKAKKKPIQSGTSATNTSESRQSNTSQATPEEPLPEQKESPGWQLNEDQRRVVDRCRDDFRSRLDHKPLLCAACVYNPAGPVPWAKIVPPGAQCRPFRMSRGDRMAIALYAEQLEERELDFFHNTAHSLLMVMHDSDFWVLRKFRAGPEGKDWRGAGAELEAHWLAIVFACSGDARVEPNNYVLIDTTIAPPPGEPGKKWPKREEKWPRSDPHLYPLEIMSEYHHKVFGHDHIALFEKGVMTASMNAVDHMLRQFVALAPDVTPAGGTQGGEKSKTPVLSRMKTIILVKMHDLKAFDSDHRVTADDIAPGKANSIKRPLSELAKVGYVESRGGGGGGSWLTPSGMARAKVLIAKGRLTVRTE